MKKFLTIIVALVLSAPIFAQKDANAKKVLDATANKITSSKGIKVDFQLTSFTGKTEQGSSSGTMYLDGKKYKIVSPDFITWFDGKTQSVYLPENDEVNVSIPTKAEQMSSNPYSFVMLYKNGYNYTLTQTTYNGKKVYEVTLKAEDASADIQEARIDISTDYIPVSVRLRQGKNTWTRIRVTNFAGKQKFSKGHFTFNKSEYPTAEIIDLR